MREFLARGTAKDRKQIVKVIKPHIEKMCTDEEAQLVLFTALDVIECVQFRLIAFPINDNHTQRHQATREIPCF